MIPTAKDRYRAENDFNNVFFYKVEKDKILRLHAHLRAWEGESKLDMPYALNLFAKPTQLNQKDDLLRNRLNPNRLKIYTKKGQEITVTQLYESHVVYRNNTIFEDFIHTPSMKIQKKLNEINRDRDYKGLEELKPKGYIWHGKEYKIEGNDHFYSYIYSNVLSRNTETQYQIWKKRDLAITDGWYNDRIIARTRNKDPALAIAQYIYLKENNTLDEALKSPEKFKEAISKIQYKDISYKNYVLQRVKEEKLHQKNEKGKQAPTIGRQKQKEPIKEKTKKTPKSKGISM